MKVSRWIGACIVVAALGAAGFALNGLIDRLAINSAKEFTVSTDSRQMAMKSLLDASVTNLKTDQPKSAPREEWSVTHRTRLGMPAEVSGTVTDKAGWSMGWVFRIQTTTATAMARCWMADRKAMVYGAQATSAAQFLVDQLGK